MDSERHNQGNLCYWYELTLMIYIYMCVCVCVYIYILIINQLNSLIDASDE